MEILTSLSYQSMEQIRKLSVRTWMSQTTWSAIWPNTEYYTQQLQNRCSFQVYMVLFYQDRNTLGYRKYLSKCCMIDITEIMLLENSETGNRNSKIYMLLKKLPNIWKLNNTLMNTWVKGKWKRNQKIFRIWKNWKHNISKFVGCS